MQLAIEGTLHISAMTRTEILAGMRPHEETDTMILVDSFITLPIDKAISDQAGRFIYQYARKGITLAFPDALIAATTFVHGLTLITTNGKHFPMPELSLQVINQTHL